LANAAATRCTSSTGSWSRWSNRSRANQITSAAIKTNAAEVSATAGNPSAAHRRGPLREPAIRPRDAAETFSAITVPRTSGASSEINGIDATMLNSKVRNISATPVNAVPRLPARRGSNRYAPRVRMRPAKTDRHFPSESTSAADANSAVSSATLMTSEARPKAATARLNCFSSQSP